MGGSRPGRAAKAGSPGGFKAGRRNRDHFARCAFPVKGLYLAGRSGEAVMFSFRKKLEIPSADEALPGRSTAIPTARQHFVNGHALKGPYPDGLAMAMFG